MVEELFQNVSPKKATELIVAEIQDLILADRLKPGEKLPSERDLSEKFNVSRNVLRESLGVLRQRGLVQVHPGRGTLVTTPSLSSMRDSLSLLLQLKHVSLEELCDARLLIEPELASRAASCPASLDMSHLTELARLLSDSTNSPEEHVQADLAFHQEIADLSGHGVLSAIVGAVLEPVTRSMFFGTKIPRAIESSDEQHMAILHAITRRNPKDARQAMFDHLQYVSEYIRDNDLVHTGWSAEQAQWLE